ncbi:MAG TPA: DnaA regulatory inactivator Hda [Chromatiales bacterium]|nr:DnaA regulatory inactivator Hda [Thiotrichales bacterium]HIP68749.1 DnaA regulatory inactivator Hda [Chromatiales bacterium]
MKQLPLPISLSPRATFETFVTGDNEESVACLKGLLQSHSEPQAFIWSKAARGKTHLLQAICHQAAEENKNAAYVPLKELAESDPRLLHGMEQLDIICIDDIHLAGNDKEWAVELFNLINRCREQKTPLVFSATKKPQEMSLALEDLRSRLMWGPMFYLKKLQDEDLFKTVTQRAENIGLEISLEATQYLFTRSRRDIKELLQIIDQLDKETIIQQRRVTLPLIRSVLESRGA